MTGPLPVPTEMDRPYWDGAAVGRLRMQSCVSCQQVFFPPGRRCRHCGSAETQWRDLSGRGRIWSWVTFQRRYFPDMPPPYIVVRVRLDEGPFLTTNLVETGGRPPAIDDPVRIVFQDAGGLVLPQFTFDNKNKEQDQ